MFGKGVTLFRILGFRVNVDVSWIVLAVLVTWSLSEGLFPRSYEGLPGGLYWLMGAAGALGLFFSILFHEFCHSLVARRFGLPMKGITLFIFGGVAEMDDEPPSARAEFMMAIAGPLSSILLGILFYGAAIAAAVPVSSAGNGIAFSAVLGYLAVINWVLAIFNLIPAFPLDGGRILRAALWHWKKDLRRSTFIASRIGSGFGLVVVLLGIVNLLVGNMISGLWNVMIGMFLRSAAQMSYRQVLVRRSLEGETVSRFMNPHPVSAPAGITIRNLVDEYVQRYHYKLFPVNQDGKLLGCISTGKIKNIPREEWDRKTVGESMDGCSMENSVQSDTAAMKAFTLMGRTGKSRLMVVDNDRLVGIITLKDLMSYLVMKMDVKNSEEIKQLP